MNKKGIAIIGEETGRILVAVLVILGLIYLAFSLYGLFIAKSRLQQASAGLDEVIANIEGLEEGQSKGYILANPHGWALTGWPFTPKFGGEKMPDDCKIGDWEKCICICKFADSLLDQLLKGDLGSSQDFLDGCNDVGVCKEIDSEEYPEFIVNPKGDVTSLGPKMKHSPILIDVLVRDGKVLNIDLEKGGKLVISAK